MNEKTGLQITEGSTYRIISIGGRENALETEGIFKGFSNLGVDEIGLLIQLNKHHGEDEGIIRIVPLHAILAIDVLDEKSQVKKDDMKENEHYFG